MKGIQHTILLFILPALLASCMGSSVEKTTYQRIGIAQLAPSPRIFTEDGFWITAKEIELSADLQEGDCFRINFVSSGYRNESGTPSPVDILSMDTIPTFPFAAEFTDTLGVYQQEERISSINVRKAKLIDNRLFLETTHSLHIANEQEHFQLSYDWEEPPDFNDSIQIYDLFLRAVKIVEDTEPDTLGYRRIYTSAFDLTPFINHLNAIPGNEGMKELTLRFRYINSDTTALTWGATSTVTLRNMLPLQ